MPQTCAKKVWSTDESYAERHDVLNLDYAHEADSLNFSNCKKASSVPTSQNPTLPYQNKSKILTDIDQTCYCIQKHIFEETCQHEINARNSNQCGNLKGNIKSF